MNCSGTLQGCRRLHQRLVLPNKLLPKRSIQQRLFKATKGPIYTRMMVYYKNDKEHMQFNFWNNDIEQCLKGTRRRWVKSMPKVPNIWPVKIGTNLSRKEILDLKNAGF
jgi:transposase-like protein